MYKTHRGKMKPKKKTNVLLHAALQALAHHLHWKMDSGVQETGIKDAEGPDAILRMEWQTGGCVLAAEVNPFFTRAMIEGVIRRFNNFPEKGVLVTRYVPAPLAEDLKEMDVQFMDTAGNAYINNPPVYLFIKGNKPVKTPEMEPADRAFHTMGLKVVFTLLCNPHWIRRPYREIAEAAGVALGTVGRVIKDLQRLGFLIEMGKKGRHLVDKPRLLERWINGYAEKLRPKVLIGKYKAANPGWWKDEKQIHLEVLWGGEVAAAKLTQYLKPKNVTLYMDNTKTLGKILLKNRLIKDKNGDVEILKVFWNFEHNRKDFHLVPPLLIYADLVITGDKRNLDTAGMIYEKELARFIDEN